MGNYYLVESKYELDCMYNDKNDINVTKDNISKIRSKIKKYITEHGREISDESKKYILENLENLKNCKNNSLVVDVTFPSMNEKELFHENTKYYLIEHDNCVLMCYGDNDINNININNMSKRVCLNSISETGPNKWKMKVTLE